ncbi:MAG: hypothetical protein CVU97_03980, partial [Firmicutes bacterium HGW-Firmicutes-21]
MNAALLKQGIKSTWKTLVIFAAVVTMYVSIMVLMYDPEMSKVFEEFINVMPQMMAAFGMNAITDNMTDFLASYLYGFILILFPMVFIIITANSLVVRHIDRGSMAYLLASPNKRNKIAFTQALTLILGIFILVAYAALLGIAVSEASFPGEIDIIGYLLMNLGLFCLHFFIGGLCFFASCITDEVRKSTLIGGGIAIVSYLFQSIANVGEKFEYLRYATFFTLFDTELLIDGTQNGLIMAGILLVGGVLFFGTGI